MTLPPMPIPQPAGARCRRYVFFGSYGRNDGNSCSYCRNIRAQSGLIQSIKPMSRQILALASLILFALLPLSAQEQKPQDDITNSSSPALEPPADVPRDVSPDPSPTPSQTLPQAPTPSPKMTDMAMPDMKGMNNDGSAHAMLSMADRQMDMGPHMKMTTLRDLKPGDQEKADQVVAAARTAAEKYTDYKVALADGFKIFLPNLPQKNITLPTTATHSKPPFSSIPNIPRRCSTRKTAMDTN